MPHRLWLALCSCVFLIIGATASASTLPSSGDVDATPLRSSARAGATRLAQAEPDPSAPAQAASDEPIGNVVTLVGSATVTRNNVATPLKLKDDILPNDVVRTAADSRLGITFDDATTFNLSANSTITIDNYVYQDGGKDNAGMFDIGKGTVAFVAAAIAKTGDMKITTPTATMGIRGTTGVIEVPENASPTSASSVAIKLYPDPDSRVGRIEVFDRVGTRLGALTLGASGFSIRPGMGGGRMIAAPLAISLQQARRDQGFVRELHAAQRTGRRIVTQQRALRRANQLRNNPMRPQTPRRSNGLPGQPGQPPLPAIPNQQGQQQPPAASPPQQATPQQAPPVQQRPRLQRSDRSEGPARERPRAAPKKKRPEQPRR